MHGAWIGLALLIGVMCIEGWHSWDYPTTMNEENEDLCSIHCDEHRIHLAFDKHRDI